MKKIYTKSQAREADLKTSRLHKIPSLVLMERAALSVADFIEQHYSRTDRILCLAGTGNNGGDAMALCRILYVRGYSVNYCLLGPESKLTESARVQYESLLSYGLPGKEPDWRDCDLIVDGIFGIGLSREIAGPIADLIQEINTGEKPVIALDIPSGLDADTGAVLGACLRTDETFSFQFLKPGLLLGQGRNVCGRVHVAEIGIAEPDPNLLSIPRLALEEEDMHSLLPVRDAEGNKASFGKVLVIAGSDQISGAAVLSARAALTSGAGMVRVYTHENNRVIIGSAFPEALITTYGDSRDKDVLEEAMNWADSLLIGPGLGQTARAEEILDQVLSASSLPMVIDADALNLLSKNMGRLLKAHHEMVLTPHMGEMARMTGESMHLLKGQTLRAAEEFAGDYQVHLILKDATTVTALPYSRTYINTSGNSGMATAGSGDVLAGICAGLIAQGMEAGQAAACSVFIHGLAGDLAASRKGARSLLAGDLLETLPEILKKFSERKRGRL